MPVIVGATQICAREAGKHAFIGPFMMGPLNCASQLRGVENLMTDTLDRPEFVDALLDFCTTFLIDFGKALIDAGADAVFLGEALCSPDMISPRFYTGTVVPRQQRLICALKAVCARACRPARVRGRDEDHPSNDRYRRGYPRPRLGCGYGRGEADVRAKGGHPGEP